MQRLFLIALFLLAGMGLHAQYILKGIILDEQHQQAVAGATIQVSTDPDALFITDSTGQFQASIKAFPCSLIIRHLSYEPKEYPVQNESNTPIEIHLTPSSASIGEVAITAERNRASENELKQITFRQKDMESMTSGFGEADIIRSLQALPGIQKSSEVNAALNVRGTGHGHNQITVDGQPLLNSYHLLGIAPMFNPDILESISLLKSGFPSQKGYGLSSFLDVNSRSADLYEEEYSVAVSNLTAKAQYETPLTEGKSSLLLSGRYSFFDVVATIYQKLHQSKKDYIALPDYRLYDLFGKLHFLLKNDWTADISAMHTRDHFIYLMNNVNLDTDWSNSLLSLNLGKTWNDYSRLDLRTGLSYYDFTGSYNPSWLTERENTLVSWDQQLKYQYRFPSGISIHASWFSRYRSYHIESREKTASFLLREADESINSFSSGAGGEIHLPFAGYFEAIAGARFTTYHPQSGEWIYKLAPRLQINGNYGPFATNLSYDRNYQFAHLISPLGFNMPADLWVPVQTPETVQQADQWAFHLNYTKHLFSVDMGVFYKKMSGLSELGFTAELISFHPADALIFGKGEAWGIETALHLEPEKWQAHLYYTYASSRRTFADVNDGRPYSPPYDLPHQIDMELKGQLSSRLFWNLSWFHASGQVTTMPTGYTFLPHGPESKPTPLYTERYNFRMPPSHRMDVSMSWKKSATTGGSLTLGVYNVYSNSNPYFLYFTIEETTSGDMQVQPKQLAIFPLTPFVKYIYRWK